MSKLYRLKKWLSVADTARHLSIAFGEEVGAADVLQFALEGQLKLSVHLVNHAQARLGKVVGYEDTEWRTYSPAMSELIPGLPEEAKGKPIRAMKSLVIDEDRYINLDPTVSTIEGVWDLPMIGGERLDVEHAYQLMTDGPAVSLQSLSGAFLEKSDGTICQLQESFDSNPYIAGSTAQLEDLMREIASADVKDEAADELLKKHKEERKQYLERRQAERENDYYPAAGLPEDSVLVVRTDAIRDFERLVSESEQMRSSNASAPLGDGERETMQKQIAALALLLSEKSSLYRRGSKPNGSQIASAVAELVDAIPMADGTGLSRASLGENISAGLRYLKA